MKHYFFECKEEKGKLHVYPLAGQMKGAETIDPSKKVSCDTYRRELGTIYVSGDIKLSARGYYTLGKGGYFVKLDDYCHDDGDVSVKEEYAAFLESTKKVEEPSYEFEEKAPEPEEPKIPTFYDDLVTDESLKAPKSDVDGFYMESADWHVLTRNIKRHINTMILGPAGTGKTSVVKLLCEKLGVKLHIFDMSSMMDPISSLLGVHRLESGASIFDYAKFTQVIQEPCVILLDELSRAPQSAMNILFPCLDDRRSLSIEIACSKGPREIKVHPDVTFIATANVGAEYSGTNSMDRALVDRFFPVELGYIPSKEEEKVLVKRTGISENDSKLIVKITQNIRTLANQQEVSVSPSIRETLMIADLVSDGWSLTDAMKRVLLPLFEGTMSSGERSTIFKTLASY